jgi:DNA-binding NarL/FixJ family response regulator
VSEGPPIRVVIVDDHDLVAETVRRALSAESDLAVVGSAGSVAGAVEAVGEQQPDVVVMDYRLPDGTGAEATRTIKAQFPDVEVVMLTGESSGEILATALEAGCSGFVAKEGRFDDLIDAIRSVAAGEVRVPAELVQELATHLRYAPVRLGEDLSPREREVLALLAGGSSTAEIASKLFLSIHTVRNHVRNLLAKLQARSRLEAVTIATRLGIISPADFMEPERPGDS